MTRTLLLVRHAKAVPDGVTDAARPLAPRGVRDARAAGHWLVEHGLVPDHVVVSPAVRTLQTWQAMSSVFTAAPPVETDARIYDSTDEALLAVVHDADDHAVLALVGHNPSMHAFALTLEDGSGDERARTELDNGFPTSSVAVLTVPGAWADLNRAGATLRAFVAPRG